MRQTREVKEAVRSAMRNRAYEMAHSGDHSMHWTIEEELRREFEPDPHFLFSSPEEKSHFDKLCQAAQRRKADAQGT
jgi:hypothetical protein